MEYIYLYIYIYIYIYICIYIDISKFASKCAEIAMVRKLF